MNDNQKFIILNLTRLKTGVFNPNEKCVLEVSKLNSELS
jgi:hypothetical protein